MQASFSIQAGVAVRGFIKRAIERLCMTLEVKYQITENKGFLDSLYHVKLEGDDKAVKQILELARDNFGYK